jgi:hypothetical protein
MSARGPGRLVGWLFIVTGAISLAIIFTYVARLPPAALWNPVILITYCVSAFIAIATVAAGVGLIGMRDWAPAWVKAVAIVGLAYEVYVVVANIPNLHRFPAANLAVYIAVRVMHVGTYGLALAMGRRLRAGGDGTA